MDAEDLRIAKATVSKVLFELNGEALELAKATLRHEVVKEAATRALAGGAVAAVVPE